MLRVEFVDVALMPGKKRIVDLVETPMAQDGFPRRHEIRSAIGLADRVRDRACGTTDVDVDEIVDQDGIAGGEVDLVVDVRLIEHADAVTPADRRDTALQNFGLPVAVETERLALGGVRSGDVMQRQTADDDVRRRYLGMLGAGS